MSVVDASPMAIPVPPDFPVHWETPEQASYFWQWERMHFPYQAKALEGSFIVRVEGGFNGAAATYDLPVRFATRHINTYIYQATVPTARTPEEMAEMGRRAEARLAPIVGRLGAYRGEELLPALKTHLAFWEAFDLAGASDAALLAHLEETHARFGQVWEIHFHAVIPMLMAMSLFDDLYTDLFGADDAFASQRLVQGLPNKSTEGGQALWALSRAALAVPVVRRVLEERAAGEVVAALEESPEGRAFLGELRRVLDAHGQRGNAFFDVASPSWVEDPTPAIKNLKDFIAQPGRDLAAEMAALAAEREQALAEVRARLAGYPAPVVGQFEALLAAAQAATVLQEDHNYWIDQRSSYKVRRVLVAVGERLAARGAIERADDVFHLTWEEMVATLARVGEVDRRALVRERQAEMAHFSTIQAPPALGTLPPGPPPDSPMTRAMVKFFGGPPQAPTAPGLLHGNAGSPGIARGRARVVRSLAEAGALQAGEVLVTETTAPPWTPLFATAAAVVTDTGGILSHCAIVAREYRIPAVVGAAMATAVIKTGQMLEIDGNAGTIRIITEN